MLRKTTNLNHDLEHLIEIISNKYAPDKRTEVFQIEVVKSDERLQLKGETSNRLAYKELIAGAREIDSLIEENIRILPDKIVEENNWGVVYNSVANLRSKPAHSSELVSQLLLGMPVKILDVLDEWTRIQAPEGYIGWIAGSLKKFNHKELKNYLAKPKIVVTNQCAKSYTKANIKSQPVSDIVIGNTVTLSCEDNYFYKTTYPDGRIAFVEKHNAQKVEKWMSKIELTGKSIARRAMQQMGVPYLWGGTSSKGLDCSGFTKMIYWLHGIIIPRDASQQINCGAEIDNKGNFENLEKGDLLFFGEKATDKNPKEKVVHVGIYIGNRQFIHASDYVHISSFNHEDKLFDAFNTHRYLRTMRYIGHEGTSGIIPIVEHPFYSKD